MKIPATWGDLIRNHPRIVSLSGKQKGLNVISYQNMSVTGRLPKQIIRGLENLKKTYPDSFDCTVMISQKPKLNRPIAGALEQVNLTNLPEEVIASLRDHFIREDEAGKWSGLTVYESTPTPLDEMGAYFKIAKREEYSYEPTEQELKDFIKQGLKPDKANALHFFGHGSNVRICHLHSEILSKLLLEACLESNVAIDLLIADTCLASHLPGLMYFAGVVRYILASPEVVNGNIGSLILHPELNRTATAQQLKERCKKDLKWEADSAKRPLTREEIRKVKMLRGNLPPVVLIDTSKLLSLFSVYQALEFEIIRQLAQSKDAKEMSAMKVNVIQTLEKGRRALPLAYHSDNLGRVGIAVSNNISDSIYADLSCFSTLATAGNPILGPWVEAMQERADQAIIGKYASKFYANNIGISFDVRRLTQGLNGRFSETDHRATWDEDKRILVGR